MLLLLNENVDDTLKYIQGGGPLWNTSNTSNTYAHIKYHKML